MSPSIDRGPLASKVKTAAKLGAGIALAGIAGIAWSYRETTQFTLREATVPVLPAGTPDVRVLHISDLHLTPSQDLKVAWVRALADLEPDVVVNTGDNMAHRRVLPLLLDALEPLLALPGAFALGSNDLFSPLAKNPARYLFPGSGAPVLRTPDMPWRELSRAMTHAGWHDMTNTRAVIELPQITLDLVGVADAHLDHDEFPAERPTSDALSTTDRARLRVGITHAPYTRVLNAMVDDGAKLLLAGHTHGGQLCIPGFGALVTNCDLDRGRASGLHGWPGPRPDEFGGQGSAWLNVSAGLGTSPYTPVRFACRPEASLLTLTAR